MFNDPVGVASSSNNINNFIYPRQKQRGTKVSAPFCLASSASTCKHFKSQTTFLPALSWHRLGYANFRIFHAFRKSIPFVVTSKIEASPMLKVNNPGARIYMDANATTPLLPEVMEAMRPFWMEHFGNASSIHLDGQQARTALDRARETMAEFFNCHDAEVVFNSGGTEGDNTALFVPRPV